MLIRNRSISLRLTIWFLTIFFLGWMLFGAAMWLDLRHSLITVRRQTLEHRVDRLSQVLLDSQPLPMAERTRKFHQFASATGDGLIEVFDAESKRFYPSPSSTALSFPWPKVASLSSEQFTNASFSGQPYLVLVRPVELDGQVRYLCVAASLTNNRALLQRFTIALLAAAPILLIASAAAGYFISRKALVPVDRITATVQSISVSNLSGRLPALRTGDELQRLTDTFNAVLTRLEGAVSHIRQFTGDASHELRGPITYMRMVSELAMREPAITDESRKAFQDVVDESAKASLLLEDMLTLARADSGDCDVPLEPCDLTAIMNEVCDKIRPLALARTHTLTLAMEHAGPSYVLANASSLSRLFWILLDNAVKYTPSPGHIEVTLSNEQTNVVVAIKDNGIGIQEEEIPLIFQRFYRTDPSRSQVDGSGLGLAIAKWIASVHHADLTVTSAINQGTTFRISLPNMTAPRTYQDVHDLRGLHDSH
jgi:heavy metal sensor kinase